MSPALSALLLPAAFICSAVSFPAMLFERPFPVLPSAERLAWEHERTWFHNLKNITTEFLRADSQWWSKFLSFCVLVLIVTTLI